MIRHSLPIPSDALFILEGRWRDAIVQEPVAIELKVDAQERRSWSSDPEFGRRSKLKRAMEARFMHDCATDESAGGMRTDSANIAMWDASIAHGKALVSSALGTSDQLGVIADIVADWLKCYHYELLTRGDQPSMLRDLYRVAIAGLCPIVWRGPWPRGFCIAYSPPAHPWAKTGAPPEWQPSPADRTAGKTKPKHLKPLVLPVPDEPVVPASAWTDLATQSDAAAAIAQWLAPWAETPACRTVLQAVAARVVRIEPTAKVLRLHVLAEDDRPQLVELAAPFTGELAPMPGSAARLIRRHNGVTFVRLVQGREHDRVVLCPGWIKKRFPAEFDAWWQADPWDPNEPFMKPPLVPCMDEQDLWVYHPHRLRAPGELELRRIDHERGDLRDALPYGAGGVILRLLAEQLVPPAPGRRDDFDLRLDDESEEA